MTWNRWATAAFLVVGGLMLLNVLSYQHARAMLNFSAEAERTPPPASLSLTHKLKVLCCGVSVPRPVNLANPESLGLPSETIRFAADDGVQLEAWLLRPPAARGTVAVFHGYASSRSNLLPEARAFYEHGLAVILVDFRGSGGSDGNATSLGIHEARDVAAAVRVAQERALPRPLILYGQSMGAAATLRSIATQKVQPDGVILESVFDQMLTTVRNRFSLMGIPSFPAAECLVYWGGVQMGTSGFEHNPVDYACACDCPALLLHGAEDLNAKLTEGQAVFERLQGGKDLVIFPAVGHTSLLTAQPARWSEAVGEFVDQRVAASRAAGVGHE